MLDCAIEGKYLSLFLQKKSFDVFIFLATLIFHAWRPQIYIKYAPFALWNADSGSKSA